MKAVVTGASGLLGRPVVKQFENAGWEVIGTAYSRAKNNLLKLDLTDGDAVEQFLNEHKPDVVVHCAAERRPDVADQDRDGALRLNVETPKKLGKLCKEKHIMLIYISTDYVFDGTSPPYEVDDKPNPLQFYGETKLAGEEAIKSVYPDATILRVPILYGHTEYNSESAINILIDVVMNSDKPSSVDNVAVRYPTNVEDVGRVLKDLAVAKLQNGKDIKGIYHFTARECLTKYQVCEIFADVLNVSINHLTPQNTVDKAASVSRPENSHLSVKRLEEDGIDTGFVKFTEWCSNNLSSKNKQ
ncbi:Methionine adenosyltransferase 2 subunit beta [Choanephora cucurbitarum]|uniref:Methionine adenosyltransferase 2 subunit beta n=1 Tax=Choanephora cucurbitarum TaxID=101091 RepID=A0A1C7N1F2_9FUNG|nr:Methionine adenosyltransferase 2 subunit beta [Choanephora cucurbitarum]